ncbi:MAG: PorV/PorQ family protein [Bacteroidetes bacterium]|nr:PorV/PorQ family protein [Bacteroidota bacterium]
MTRAILGGLAALLLVPIVAGAQGFVNAKYASEFLSSGVGGRSAGIGGAGTAFTNDVTAGYFNPAALSLVTYPQIALLHESRFAGEINYDYLAGALPLDSLQTVSLSAIRLGVDGIKDSRDALIDQNGNMILDEEDRIDPTKIRIGSAADWAIFGSYSRKVNDQLSLGGSVKLIYKTVLEHSAWGVGVDVSALYRPVENLSLGASLTDATKSLLIWDTGTEEFIVPTLRMGAAYRYRISNDHSIMPAIDGSFRFEGRQSATMVDLGIASLDVQGGLEYSYKDRIFLRGGYTDLKQITIGAGVKLPKLNIDYAFTKQSSDLASLGATHRISLTLTLEEPKYVR